MLSPNLRKDAQVCSDVEGYVVLGTYTYKRMNWCLHNPVSLREYQGFSSKRINGEVALKFEEICQGCIHRMEHWFEPGICWDEKRRPKSREIT